MSDLPQLSTNCFLNGKPHLLHLNLTKSAIALTLTNKSTMEKWKSVATVEYIESMTRKTGNFKTFPIFADMMKAVFLNASPSLSIKLLTQGELEKLSNSNVPSSFSESPGKRRIYFILIYTSEFDRIHYPLPMDFAGFPNPEILQATIHSLENDKSSLERQLEQYRLEFEAIKFEQVGPLKQNLISTADRCAELEKKFVAISEELDKLKREIVVGRESWKNEFGNFTKMQDSKMKELSTEFRNLIEHLTPDSNLPRLNRKRCTSPRISTPSQRDERRWNCGRSPIQSPRFNSRQSSPKRIALQRQESLRSLASVSSPRSGRHPSGKKSEQRADPNNFSDSEVTAVREQIEALQRAVLGLADNFKPSS